MLTRRQVFPLIILLVLLSSSCAAPATPAPAPAAEISPVSIPLTGALARPGAEISGLAWHAGHLILLTQYPDFEKRRNIDPDAEPGVFAIAKTDLLAVLDGGRKEPVNAKKVRWVDDDLVRQIEADGFDFQGYESIAFAGDRVFVTVEAEDRMNKDIMRAYLLAGAIQPDLSMVKIDTTVMPPIESAAEINQMSQEAILVVDGKVITFYEANGVGVNRAPKGYVFDRKTLAWAGTVPFPNIDYRIADATTLDNAGRFWAINYHFPGETEMLKAPKVDALATRYGQGPTHAMFPQLERLVEFQYKDTGITLTERAPVQLALVDGKTARNWGGIARLDDRGFLVATDTYPTTILAFVPWPSSNK